MSNMDAWDWGLLIAGGYLAIIILIRLMRHRRDAVLQELSHQAELERQRKRRDERRVAPRKTRA